MFSAKAWVQSPLVRQKSRAWQSVWGRGQARPIRCKCQDTGTEQSRNTAQLADQMLSRNTAQWWPNPNISPRSERQKNRVTIVLSDTVLPLPRSPPQHCALFSYLTQAHFAEYISDPTFNKCKTSWLPLALVSSNALFKKKECRNHIWKETPEPQNSVTAPQRKSCSYLTLTLHTDIYPDTWIICPLTHMSSFFLFNVKK